jgi:hypothetical protein
VPQLDFPENLRAGNITEDDNKFVENFEEKKTERMTNKTNKTQKSFHRGTTNQSRQAIVLNNVNISDNELEDKNSGNKK